MITRRGLWFIEDYPLEEGIELSEENPRIFPSTYRSMLTQGYPTTYSKKALELLRSYRYVVRMECKVCCAEQSGIDKAIKSKCVCVQACVSPHASACAAFR
jgi:hypothetical protein